MKILLLAFFLCLPVLAFATSSPAVVSVFNAGTQNVTGCTGIGYTHGSENSDGSGYAGVSGGVIYSTSGFPIAPGGWGTVTVESEHYGSPYAYYSVELGFNVATVGTVIVDTPWAAYGAPVSIAVEGSLPVFTNITLNAYNSYSVAAVATFTWNGSVVKTLTLPAGGSSSWVSPSVEVSPTADNWTANVSVNQVTPQIGSDGSGSLIFTNPSDGFSSSGTGGSYTNTSSGSGSVSSGTNGITLTSGNGSVQPSTNSVIWSAPAGSASESTLQSGFSLLHNDQAQILAGQNIINDSVNAGFLIITNQLGQLVRLQLAMSNETLQVVSAITNLNLGAGSNSFNLTNYALETTQTGILASLLDTNNSDASIFTNATYSMDSSATNAVSALASADSDLASVYSTISSATNDVASALAQSVPDGVEPDMTVDMSALTLGHATITFDMNPVHNFPWVFYFLHAAFTWIVVVAFVRSVTKTIFRAVSDYGATNPVPVPNMTGGANGVSGSAVIES